VIETIIVGVIALRAIEVMANIATWCFNEGAKNERSRQRSIIHSTRQGLRTESALQRDIQREAQQKMFEAQQAARQAHYEMLGDLWNTVQEMGDHATGILDQFRHILDHNSERPKTFPWIPQFEWPVRTIFWGGYNQATRKDGHLLRCDLKNAEPSETKHSRPPVGWRPYR
jgi:hypothetical protein